MAVTNPNNLNNWAVNGTVLPPYFLGTVSQTNNQAYWLVNGTVIYPASIDPSATTGFFLFM